MTWIFCYPESEYRETMKTEFWFENSEHPLKRDIVGRSRSRRTGVMWFGIVSVDDEIFRPNNNLRLNFSLGILGHTFQFQYYVERGRHTQGGGTSRQADKQAGRQPPGHCDIVSGCKTSYYLPQNYGANLIMEMLSCPIIAQN